MKFVATRKSEQNRTVLDPWSVVHFASGLAAGLARVDRRLALGAAIAYEFIEQGLERKRIGQEMFHVAGPEAPVNALADVALFGVGLVLGERWNRSGETE